MEKDYNTQQDKCITKLSTDMDWLKKEVEDIKTNHLKEIYNKLESQKTWLIGVLGAIIITLVVGLLNLIVI